MTKRHFVAALLGLLLVAGAAGAAEFTAGGIQIIDPWIRASGGMAKAGGAFMTLTNQGEAADVLVGGSSPLAERVEVHETTVLNNIMRMRPVDRLEIRAGQSVQLKPGSYHVMLSELREQLTEGKKVPMTLRFEKAGEVEIEAVVMKVGTMNVGHHH